MFLKIEEELNFCKKENEQQKSRITMIEQENSKLQSNHATVSDFFELIKKNQFFNNLSYSLKLIWYLYIFKYTYIV